MNNRWGVAALVAAVLLILVTPAGILAQEAAQGWTVALPAEIHARPGEFVTTVLSVADATGHPDTYLWEANLPAGWQSLVASNRIVLGPNGEDIVFLTFHVPDNAMGGNYPVSVAVTRERDGEQRTVETSVSVATVRRLVLEEIAPPRGQAGETLDYAFAVRNMGNTVENVIFEVSAPRGWDVAHSTGAITLEPGERQVVTVPVRSMREIRAGQVRGVVVQVRSEDDVITENLTLSATITPPRPELVPRLGPDTIPARLQLTSGRMREGEVWDPTLTFAASGRAGLERSTFLSLLMRFRQDNLHRPFLQRFDTRWAKDPYELVVGIARSNPAQHFTPRLTLTYDKNPLWWSLGDVSLSLTPLVSTSGRGGAIRYFGTGADFGLSVLGRTAGVTLGAGSESALVRGTLLADESNNRSVASLYGRVNLSEVVAVEGETVTVGDDRLWFVGTDWRRSPWRLTARYFSYGSTSFGSGWEKDRSGYDVSLRGRLGNAPFQLSARDVRTNASGDPTLPIEALSDASLSTSFPIGRAAFRATLGWSGRRTLEDPTGGPEIHRERLVSGFTLQRSLRNWYWIIRGDATSTADYKSGDRDAAFSFGPAIGRSWPTIRAEVGVVYHGTGETLAEATENSSVGPRLSLDWRPDSIMKPRLRLDYFGGERARLTLRGSFEIARSFDFTASAHARYHDLVPDWSYTVGLVYRFGLPVPGVYSRGNIEGRVYVVNGNGFSGEPEGLEGIVLAADGVRVSTDAEGRFRFPGLAEGEYELTLLNMENVALAYEAQTGLPLLVEVQLGETTEVDIPIRLKAQLTGRVYWESGLREELIQRSLQGIVLEFRQNGNTVARITTDSLGFYQTPLLEPGRYEVSVVPGTLPRWSGLATDMPFIVELTPGKIQRHDIGLVELEVPIRLDVDASEQ